MTMKTRFSIALLTLIICVTIWLLIAHRSENQASQLKNSLTSLQAEEVKARPVTTDAGELPNSASSIKSRSDSEGPSSAEIEAMSLEEYLAYVNGLMETLPSDVLADIHTQQAINHKHWENIGFFDEEQKSSYASYNRETLLELGNQGDILALDILADMYLLEDRDREKSTEINMQAVLFGSAIAASKLAISADSPTLYGNKLTKHKSYIYKEMTWHKVSAMMGNKAAEGIMNSILKAQGVTLSEEEWSLIQKQADITYEQLNNKRREIGLSDYER